MRLIGLSLCFWFFAWGHAPPAFAQQANQTKRFLDDDLESTPYPPRPYRPHSPHRVPLDANDDNPPPPPPEPPQTSRQRRGYLSPEIQHPRPFLTLRALGYSAVFENEFFNSYSASAELRILHPIVLDVGFDLNPLMYSIYGRAGYSHFLFRFRDQDGKGIELTLNAYIGYRHLRITAFNINDTYDGVNLYGGMDFYFWFGRRLGLTLHIGMGTTIWFLKSNEASPANHHPEIRTAFGIAF